MRIVGMACVGPNEKYLKSTLDEFKRLCDDTIICTNNADEETKALIKSYGFWTYEDPREWGKEQPLIKTDLLARVAKLRPDWIIALDADEVFAPEFTRERAEYFAGKDEVAWYFIIVNLYNDKEHFAHSSGIQRFWNIRFFRFLPKLGLVYQKKNLHCGLAPPFAYAYGWHAPYYIEHYGLMTKEDRLRKAERYKKYDPTARFKDRIYYDELEKDLKMIPFDKQGLLNKLAASTDCKPRIAPKIK